MSKASAYQKIMDFIHALNNAEDIDCQWQLLRATVDDLGFNGATYAFLPATSPRSSYDDLIWMDGYPKGWRTRYEEKGFAEHDLIVKHCLASRKPLDWHDLLPRIDNGSLSKEETRVFVDAREFGLDRGITFPLRDAAKAKGGVSFCPGSWIGDKEYRQHLGHVEERLNAYAELFHAIADQKTLTRQDFELSAREIECLKWICEGLQQKNIAYKMGISIGMVEKYISNIKGKMNAATLTQVVAKTTSLNLINR